MKGLEGLLKCDAHNESFNLPEEFYQHEREKSHSHTGITLCVDCNASGIKEHAVIDSDELNFGRPIGRCSDCQEVLEKKVEEKMRLRKK